MNTIALEMQMSASSICVGDSLLYTLESSLYDNAHMLHFCAVSLVEVHVVDDLQSLVVKADNCWQSLDGSILAGKLVRNCGTRILAPLEDNPAKYKDSINGCISAEVVNAKS